MVAIKDMEMPRWCVECPMCREETIEGNTTTYCSSLNRDITWNGNRVENCPLVEIVTCKNCKYNAYETKIKGDESIKIFCRKNKTYRCIDGFCSDGKRRE